MNEELKNKYPNLFGASFSKDDAYMAVADVVVDTVSGVVGPAAAAVGSMVDQALTNKSLVDLRSNKERFANMLNFEPRSKVGAEASEYLQGKLGEGAAAVEEFWGEYKPDSLMMMDTAIDIATKEQNLANKVKVYTRNLKTNPLSSFELQLFDVIIIDPPRSGAQSQFVNIAKSQVPLVISISCNINSFIKDAKILFESNYELKWVKPIDQFLFTQHIELVGLFELR